MKKFINRSKELEFLEKQYQEKNSSLVIIYGRRRIGKTALIKKCIQHKPAIYFLASEEAENQNIEYFKKAVSNFLKNPLIERLSGVGWDDIFDVIVNSKIDKKVVIVFDEFQNLCKTNPAFASVVQRIWDEKLKNQNFMLILSGSLVGMMQEHALSYSSPLYGRRTGQIKLKQFSFKEAKEFFPEVSDHQFIWIYSIIGGVPKYLEMFKFEGDIYKAIEENILNRQSFLYEEPIFLLEKEVHEVGSYFSIIKSIALGNHKLSQIAQNLSVAQTKLTKYLNTLMDLDIVRREVPITEEYPEKSKRGLYFINDNFIDFWFKFVYPYREQLELDNTKYVLENIKSRIVTNHISFVYEEICRQILMDLVKTKEIDVQLDRVGKWWDSKSEIDIVGIGKNTGHVVFGECKYSQNVVDIDVFFNLKKKAESIKIFPEQKELYILFSKTGFSERLLEFAKETKNLILIKFP
ncbi:ATP-binding protein [Anaerocellum diazotrophicum]|uniref:ATPase n=1 Tax=Caldicellulosiruptor diazotrophicus TaxID=2806205 RepID=A0ABM7NQE9_9FIRM|nr:ATP-binding protein [Caldicellulosiruptor diazotrophicus]BCS82397.1 ATPase [Caldicellulosiruptor diazotrophicus]